MFYSIFNDDLSASPFINQQHQAFILYFDKYRLKTLPLRHHLLLCSGMQNIAVILAGGSGKRVGGDIPKQFMQIAGRTILEYSIEKFEQNQHIDEIIIVGNLSYIDEIHHILRLSPFSKVRHVVAGGEERYHSVLTALKIYKNIDCHLLIHDSVRPMVSDRIIDDVINALSEYNAVNVAIPATDTIVETDATHAFITGLPDRSRLYQVQTPQGFYLQTLEKAYSLALNDPAFTTTDDCSVIRKYMPDEIIKIVKGETTNLKLTYPEDFFLLEYLLNKENK